MAKSNIRSMRFSDDIIELIEQQNGDTFTAKFETLVTKCVWELPHKEKELRRVEDQIKREREHLRKLVTMVNSLDDMKRQIDYAASQLQRISKAADAIGKEV